MGLCGPISNHRHVAVTLNKMGHDFPETKPCQQLGLPLGAEAGRGSCPAPSTLDSD